MWDSTIEQYSADNIQFSQDGFINNYVFSQPESDQISFSLAPWASVTLKAKAEEMFDSSWKSITEKRNKMMLISLRIHEVNKISQGWDEWFSLCNTPQIVSSVASDSILGINCLTRILSNREILIKGTDNTFNTNLPGFYGVIYTDGTQQINPLVRDWNDIETIFNYYQQRCNLEKWILRDQLRCLANNVDTGGCNSLYDTAFSISATDNYIVKQTFKVAHGKTDSITINLCLDPTLSNNKSSTLIPVFVENTDYYVMPWE